MKLVIIDGQSGRMGALIAERVKAAKLPCKVLAVGTNAIATATMMKAGANQGATGENPVKTSFHSSFSTKSIYSSTLWDNGKL